jgi:hypothetical protein
MARAPRGLRLGKERWQDGQLVVDVSVVWWYWPILACRALPESGLPPWTWAFAVLYVTAAMWRPRRWRRPV